jgi:hypothetical protein
MLFLFIVFISKMCTVAYHLLFLGKKTIVTSYFRLFDRFDRFGNIKFKWSVFIGLIIYRLSEERCRRSDIYGWAVGHLTRAKQTTNFSNFS